MKAMVFAAGKGERMGWLTETVPKPLLRVADKPLIEFTLERLRRAGLTDVIINLAYLGEKIEEHLGDGSRFGLSIQYSREPEPLETGGAINHALNLLGDQPFLLVNADVWTDYPFELLQQNRLSTNDMAHLVMVSNPPEHSGGDYVVTEHHRLAFKNANEGDERRETLTYSGIALFRPALIADYPQRREKFPLSEVFDYFIARNQISAELFRGEWMDIGTPERLDEIRCRIE